MWTNKNTPLVIAVVIAAIVILIGFVIGTLFSVIAGIVLGVIAIGMGLLSRYMTHLWLTDDVRLWAWQIRGFERADRKQMPPQNAIVFVGSSTIRFWKSLAEDMHPLPVIRRGFGGSRILDAVHYADRIVIPYQPAAIVLFSGTNDIAGKLPKTAEYVADKFTDFCQVIHTALPDVPVYYLSITPTPGRRDHWHTVQGANRLIAEYTETDDRLHFIDTTDNYLDESGQPIRSLYRWDKIHLTTEGYRILTSIVKPILMRDCADLISS